jgi:hypothetical protein
MFCRMNMYAQTRTAMKTLTRKSILDEIGFVLIAVISILVLTIIIFPLFLAALPVILISGLREVWYLDHIDRTGR